MKNKQGKEESCPEPSGHLPQPAWIIWRTYSLTNTPLPPSPMEVSNINCFREMEGINTAFLNDEINLFKNCLIF